MQKEASEMKISLGLSAEEIAITAKDLSSIFSACAYV